jgi:hypothetical protein
MHCVARVTNPEFTSSGQQRRGKGPKQPVLTLQGPGSKVHARCSLKGPQNHSNPFNSLLTKSSNKFTFFELLFVWFYLVFYGILEATNKLEEKH